MIETVYKTNDILIAEYPPHPRVVNRGYPVDVKNLMHDLMRDCARNPLPLEDDPTVTSYWYKYVKPLLARLGIITEETSGKDILGWRAYHNQRCAELVKAGEITYRQLNIVDRSRQSISAEEDANNPNIICLVEKDAAYSVVKKLNTVYGVNVLEGHGMPSLAKVENMLDELQRICPGETVVLITFTDYNAAGWNIAMSFAKQVRILWPWAVEHYHAGLYLEQFNGRDITDLVEPVKGPDKTKNAWLEWLAENNFATYMVGDVPKGIELDALGSREIYKCINDYILQTYDLLKLLNAFGIEYQKKVIGGAVNRISSLKTADIEEEIMRLEDLRDDIHIETSKTVIDYIDQYGFNFSFELSEEELREHYREKQFTYDVERMQYDNITTDVDELVSIIT